MRSPLRRIQIGFGAFAAASALFLLAAPSASAGPCYTVTVGAQDVTVCPGQ